MKAYIVLLIGFLLMFGACNIHKPSLPVWDVDLAIPLVNEKYYVSDLVDSVNIIIGDNDVLYLTGSGEVDTPEIGAVSISPSINESDIPIPSGANQSIELPFLDTMDNAMLSYGELSSGSMRFRFNRIVAQTQLIQISFVDITDPAGQPFVIEYGGDAAWQTVNLTGYHFGDINSIQNLSTLDANVQANSSLPDGTPLGTMDIQMDEELRFGLFQGTLNHFEIGINSSSASIEIDYPNDVDEAITLHDAQLQIDVINQMGFNCEFEGTFEARRGDELRSIPIVDENGDNYRILAADANGPGQTTLPFDTNISSLMQIMPEHIEIVNARFIVDTISGFGSMRQEDQIFAHYTVNAPFRFELHEHTIAMEEAVKIDISADNRDYIANDLQTAALELQVQNKLPIGGWARAYFGNSPDIDTLNPDTYLFSKELVLYSAETHPDWQSPSTIILDKGELDLFTNPNIYLKWEFSFEASNGLVQVNASSADFIHVKSMLYGTLRINPEEL